MIRKILLAAAMLAGSVMPASAICSQYTDGLMLKRPAIGDNFSVWASCIREMVEIANYASPSTYTVANSTGFILGGGASTYLRTNGSNAMTGPFITYSSASIHGAMGLAVDYGLYASSLTVSGGITASSGTFTASGPSQNSIEASSSVYIRSGGLILPDLTVLYSTAGLMSSSSGSFSGTPLSSSFTMISGGDFFNTTLSSCVTGTSVTVMGHGKPMDISMVGIGAQQGVTSEWTVGFLFDGALQFGQTPTRGVLTNHTVSQSEAKNISFRFRIPAPSTGSHTACLAVASENYTLRVVGYDQKLNYTGTFNSVAQFGITEVADETSDGGGGSGSGHTITTGTIYGLQTSFASRSKLSFDDRYFRVVDSTTLDATNISGRFMGMSSQSFTASGSWTRPAGVDFVWVYLVGGGGGGGGSFADNSYNGAGGGGGGEVKFSSVDVRGISAGGSVTVTISTGANGGAGSNPPAPGDDANSTMFGSLLMALGGGGGGESKNGAGRTGASGGGGGCYSNGGICAGGGGGGAAVSGGTPIPASEASANFNNGGSSTTATSGNAGGGAVGMALPLPGQGGQGVIGPLPDLRNTVYGAGGGGGLPTVSGGVLPAGWNSAGTGSVDDDGGGDIAPKPGKDNAGQGGGGAATKNNGSQNGAAGSSGFAVVVW